MANHMAEEERQAVLREKAEWSRHVEREREKRIQEEKELAHQRRVAESQRRFKKQVCRHWPNTVEILVHIREYMYSIQLLFWHKRFMHTCTCSSVSVIGYIGEFCMAQSCTSYM